MLRNYVSIFGLAIILLLNGVQSHAQSNEGSEDTIQISVVTDSTWMVSSQKGCYACNIFPWPGVQSLPVDASFTNEVVIGQPYGFPTIKKVAGTNVIKAGPGVEFYRKTFVVDSLGAVTDCRFRVFVDDDVEIYINGIFIAREATGIPLNFNGAGHDMMIYDFGPPANPYLGGTPFDEASLQNPDKFIKAGVNEIILAVRNKSEDVGGVSFRMDLSYVVNPNWVDLPEPGTRESAFELYPNPSSDIFHIVKPNDIHAFDINLWSNDGRLITRQGSIESEEMTLDLSGYAPGIYQLQLITSSGHYTRRLILQ